MKRVRGFTHAVSVDGVVMLYPVSVPAYRAAAGATIAWTHISSDPPIIGEPSAFEAEVTDAQALLIEADTENFAALVIEELETVING